MKEQNEKLKFIIDRSKEEKEQEITKIINSIEEKMRLDNERALIEKEQAIMDKYNVLIDKYRTEADMYRDKYIEIVNSTIDIKESGR